jgi:hypothetical protein
MHQILSLITDGLNRTGVTGEQKIVGKEQGMPRKT